MSEDEIRERLADLVGVHAAGEDEAELREALAGSPPLQQRLAALRRVHARLIGASAAESPRPALSARVLSIPGLNPRPAPQRPGRRAWLAIGTGAAAAACVAAVLVFTWARDGEPGFQPMAPPATLVGSAGDPMRITIELGRASEGEQQVRLVAHGLQEGDGAYELWLEGPGGARNVARFAPDEKGECHLMFRTDAGVWTAAYVTRADGSPGEGAIAEAAI